MSMKTGERGCTMTRRNWIAVLVLLSFIFLAFFPLVRTAEAQSSRIKIAVLGVENKTDAPLSAEEATTALQKAFSGSDRYSLISSDEVARTMDQSGLSSESSTSIRAMILGKVVGADQVVIVSLNRYAVKGAKVNISAQASFYDGTDGRFLKSANISGDGSGIQDAFSNVAAKIPDAATSASQSSGLSLTKSGTLLAILGVAGVVAAVSGNKGGGDNPSSSGGSSSSSGGPTPSPTPVTGYTFDSTYGIHQDSAVVSGNTVTLHYSVQLKNSSGKSLVDQPVYWVYSEPTVVASKGSTVVNTDFTGRSYFTISNVPVGAILIVTASSTIDGKPSLTANVTVNSSGGVTTVTSGSQAESTRVVIQANPSSGLYPSTRKAASITVTVSKKNADGTIEMVNDTKVTLHQSPAGFGTFGEASQRTVNGVVNYDYYSINSGVVTLYATADELNYKESLYPKLTFGTPSIGPVSLTNNVVNRPSAGKSTQYFKVTATPAVAGYTIQWTKNGVVLGTSETDATGVATYSVEADFSSTYRITASLKIDSQTYSPQSLGVILNSNGGVANTGGSALVTLSADKTVLLADNTQQAALTAVVMDATGNLLPSVPVQFTDTPATGNFVGSNPATTDTTGKATIGYRTNASGAVDITAQSQTVTSSKVSISCGKPSVTLTANPPSILADDNSTTSLIALVKNETGDPVPDGITVNFTAVPAGSGTLSASSAVTGNLKTGDGKAVVTYKSLNFTKGNVTITAKLSDPLIKSDATVSLMAPQSQSTLSVSPSEIFCDGLSETVFSFRAINPNGTAGSGFVTFVNYGTTGSDGKGSFFYAGQQVSSPYNVNLNLDGTAALRLRAPLPTGLTLPLPNTVRAYWNNDPDRHTLATALSEIVNFSGSIGSEARTIELTAPSLNQNLQVKDTGGTQSTVIRAHVLDSEGKPVANGTVISFSIDVTSSARAGAYIEGSKAVSEGYASVNLFSGTAAGNLIINATAAASGGTPPDCQSLAIPVFGGPPASISSAIGAGSLFNIDGLEINNVQTTINVIVKDKYGNPVPDETSVSCTTLPNDIGMVDRTPFQTTGGMVSGITFRSSNVKPQAAAGKNYATVSVTAGNLTGGDPAGYVTSQVFFLVTGPARTAEATLSIDGVASLTPGTMVAGQSLRIALKLRDACGNPLAKGTIVDMLVNGAVAGSQTVADDTMGITDSWQYPAAVPTLMNFTYSAPASLGQGVSQLPVSIGFRCRTPNGSVTSTEDRLALTATPTGFVSGSNLAFNVIPDIPATVAITAAPPTLVANQAGPGTPDYATLDVLVSDANGNPILGATVDLSALGTAGAGVRFTATPPSPTSIWNPTIQLTTASSGRAVCYVAGRDVGAASINAKVGTVSGSQALTFIADAPYTMTLQAIPTTIVGDNTGEASTCNLTATVTDRFGHPCASTPDKTINVQFVCLISPSYTQPFGAFGGTAQSQILVATNDQGSAITTLTGIFEGPADTLPTTVFASIPSAPSVTNSTKDILFTRAPVTSITLTSIPATDQAVANNGGVDGTFTLAVRALNSLGHPVPNVILNLSVDLSGANLQNIDSGIVRGTSINVTTGDDGYVLGTTTLTSTARGTANILARWNLANATKTVTFNPGPPASGTLTITPASVLGDGTTTASCEVVLRDANTNLCASGITVNFAATAGSLSVPQMVTDADGKATVTIKHMVEDQSNDVTSTVSSTLPASPGVTIATKQVTFTRLPAATVTLSKGQDPIMVGNVEQSTITVAVVNSVSRPVVNQLLSLSSSLPNSTLTGGGLPPAQAIEGSTVKTGSDGKFTAILKGTRTGTATITARALGTQAEGTVAVTLKPGAPAILTLTAPPSIPADNTTTASLLALVRDSWLNPVPGYFVNFGTSLGTLSKTQETTLDDGTATVTLKHLEESYQVTDDVATVTATVAGGTVLQQSTQVTLQWLRPTTLAVQFDKPSCSVSDIAHPLLTTPPTLTVTATNKNGTPVKGLPATSSGINLASSLAGSTLAAQYVGTDDLGKGTTTLISGKAGTATVTAGYQGVNGSGPILFNPGKPETLDLQLSLGQINADDTQTTTATATVYDGIGGGLGNRAGANYNVNFAALRGGYQSSTTTLTPTSGQTDAANSWVICTIKGRRSGTDTITATVDGYTAPQSKILTLLFVPAKITIGALSPVHAYLPSVTDSYSQVFATVYSATDEPAPDNTAVNFDITGVGGCGIYLNNSGAPNPALRARSALTIGGLGQALSPPLYAACDGSVNDSGGTATITATCGAASGTGPLLVSSSPPGALVVLGPTNINAIRGNYNITFEARSAPGGVPVPNFSRIDFGVSGTGASFTPTSATTGPNGQAQCTVSFGGDASADTYILTASCSSSTGGLASATVNFYLLSPLSFTVGSPSPNPFHGATEGPTYICRFTAHSGSGGTGSAIPDIPVVFEVYDANGTLLATGSRTGGVSSGTTNASGEVTVPVTWQAGDLGAAGQHAKVKVRYIPTNITVDAEFDLAP